MPDRAFEIAPVPDEVVGKPIIYIVTQKRGSKSFERNERIEVIAD